MTGRETEYTRYAGTPQGAIELAAAGATAEVSRLFHRLAKTSGRKQNQVAELLKVTEGRVSQVLNGDGNVTIAALAKYARAFGYSLTFKLTPAEPGVDPLPIEQPRRRRDTDRQVTVCERALEALVTTSPHVRADFTYTGSIQSLLEQWHMGGPSAPASTTSTGTGVLQ
ncbi:helix-turn-helix transcriptional regulator [Nocardia cyriacigeorgica]|uniref:Helix-turn-helix transcriptional regulator n=1 Tax=Nocardia cyriacigeorgica TaxID=135487 RepID=A0A6P1CMJ8_9NOCA|nr:helix-turn-helix transcriptional regulator [Nocardia cyriacigeorgica]NEW33790.1 helix-turn-helix transcriptional regulator [Nocardia cyriacigeorgica]